MSTTPPFLIGVYDKDFNQVGTIGNPMFCTIMPKDKAAGMATVRIPLDHARVPALMAPGARIWFREWGTKAHLMSGYVVRVRIEQATRLGGYAEFDIVDDFILLQRILGWVVPNQPITAQGTAGTNWVSTGPFETVLKAALTANGVTRLGLPIQVPATAGLGPTVTARLRFHTLFDHFFPTEDGLGGENLNIGVALRQRDDAPGLRLDVWETNNIPQTISMRSGILRSWSLNRQNASVTRAVVGGSGEGTLRLLRERIDAALETSLGIKYEAFRDARDTDDPDTMYERADETIAEGAMKDGLSIELSETDNFVVKPGKLWIGDRLSIKVTDDLTVTERLREATLSYTASEGRITRSRIGEIATTGDQKLAKIVMNLARKLRNTNVTT